MIYSKRWSQVVVVVLFGASGMRAEANAGCCPTPQSAAPCGVETQGNTVQEQDMYQDGKLDLAAVKQAYFDMFAMCSRTPSPGMVCAQAQTGPS